jgi:very-short-patch-repair endonuclease
MEYRKTTTGRKFKTCSETDCNTFCSKNDLCKKHYKLKYNKVVQRPKCLQCNHYAVKNKVCAKHQPDYIIIDDNRSRGEVIIENLLIDMDEKYFTQFSFDDCVFIKKLKFDFYLPKYNLLIEYDGLQHFQPVDYYGGESGYKMNKLRDEIKNKYCKKTKINFLRIPYTYNTVQKIEKYILDFINKIIKNSNKHFYRIL